MPDGEPAVFELKGLEPDTAYDITFKSKTDDCELPTRGCVVRTTKPPEEITSFHILVCSCNRPGRLGSAQNPWLAVEKLCKGGTIDVMLHLGDQVYAEDWHREAQTLFEDADRAERENKTQAYRLAFEMEAAKIMQKSYRSTWNFAGTAGALAHSSHWMQWSDHDVANDFTIW
jgi:phosphodiesterase/alkaline phosphatase D-like protein